MPDWNPRFPDFATDRRVSASDAGGGSEAYWVTAPATSHLGTRLLTRHVAAGVPWVRFKATASAPVTHYQYRFEDADAGQGGPRGTGPRPRPLRAARGINGDGPHYARERPMTAAPFPRLADADAGAGSPPPPTGKFGWLSPEWEKRIGFLVGLVTAVALAVYTKQTQVQIPVFPGQVLSPGTSFGLVAVPSAPAPADAK